MPLLWLALLLLSAPCAAKTLVVVLLPGTSLADWRRPDAPNLNEIMATGAIAMMNTRTARLPSDHVRETPESAALTLGAGARAAGGVEATQFRRANAIVPGLGVTAGQLYARRMGKPVPLGAWVNVEWPRLLHENLGREYDIRLGDLADALQRAGVTVKSYGGPLADAVAVDGEGEVRPPASEAPPVPSNGGDRVVIWDAGSDVAGADRRLGALLKRLGDGRLIVLSTSAGNAAYAQGKRLCPVAVWGAGVAPGLIYSPSTRRAGLVTNTDFAPTVGDYFGVGPTAFPTRPFGNSWEYRPTSAGVEQAAAMELDAVRQWHGLKILPSLAVFMGLWMLGMTALDQWRTVPRGLGLLPALIILALLISVSAVSFGLWLAALSGLALAARRLGTEAVVFGLMVALAGLLVTDMLLGDPLMRLGLLGYSAIEGARFYGIGNEAMGPLVAACLIISDRLWVSPAARQKLWLWAGLALVTMLVGSPNVGAKAGGLIVAAAAFGSFVWLRSGRRWDGRAALLGMVGIAALLLLVVFLDSHLAAGRQSHFGQAVSRLWVGGAGELRDIIARKLAVEGRLLWHSTWALPLWGGLVCLLWRARRQDAVGHPWLAAGLIAVAACLAVNDAGAEAAALCVSLLWGRLFVQQTQKARRLAEQTVG